MGNTTANNNSNKKSSSSSVDKREKSEAPSGSEKHADRKSVGGSHKTKESSGKGDKSKWAHRPPPLKISAETKGSGQMPAVETGLSPVCASGDFGDPLVPAMPLLLPSVPTTPTKTKHKSLHRHKSVASNGGDSSK